MATAAHAHTAVLAKSDALLLPQVVPTEYTDLHGHSTNSNQFSVTENFRESADAHLGGRSLPGVFFFYDLSPIKVGPVLGLQCWQRCDWLLWLGRGSFDWSL